MIYHLILAAIALTGALFVAYMVYSSRKLLFPAQQVPVRPETSPFIQAIVAGNENLVRELLQNGASADETNVYGQTALMVAAVNDRGSIAELLLKAGANIAASYEGSTPLHFAAEESLDVLQKLIAAGANINAIDRLGYTPLMLAVYSEDPDRVRALLQAGAATMVTSTDGYTALSIAVDELSNGPIAALLHEYGATI